MESVEQIAFQIISAAGDAFSMMLEALSKAREGNFDQAGELMTRADKFLSEAHKAQTSLIVEESRGAKPECSVILVHAQDHLMNAMLAKPLIAEMIQLYRTIQSK